MKCSVGCLVALVLLGSLCDAQYGKPIRNPIQKPAQPVRQEPSKQVPQQPEQSRQTFEKPLTWRYPEIPQPVTQPEVPFELRYPVPAATVAVECREQIAHVEVKKDLFGIGQFINPADLTLGTCPAAAEDTGAQVLIFESLLHDCGSSLAVRTMENYTTMHTNQNYGRISSFTLLFACTNVHLLSSLAR